MQNKGLQRATYIFAISMALLMAITLIGPALMDDPTQVPQATAIPPTATPPPPTLPPPVVDFSGITFDSDYLHPSGLFSIAVPAGWEPSRPNNNGIKAQALLNNGSAVSVIEVALEKPTTPVTTAEDLDAYLSPSSLRSSWSRYVGGYAELTRSVEEDRVLIDFALADSQQRDFRAQHLSWLEGDWIYTVRVVVPENSPELLVYMVDEMSRQITVYPRFAQYPVIWDSFHDQEDLHIIRRPPGWAQTDGTSGQIVSFEGDDYGGVQMRVETEPDLIADEQAAGEWVENVASGMEVLSVVPVSRDGGEGFSVAYGRQNPDGEGLSGLVVLLNGVDEQLHVARVEIAVDDVDLNSEDGRVTYEPVANAMDSFSMLTTLRFPVEEEPEEAPEETTG